MSKFLLAAFAVLLSVSVADAGWNIRQQPDGSTVWVDDEGNTIPVGDAGLAFQLTDVSTASSSFVTAHRDGKVKKIYVVTDGATTGTAALTFYVGDGTLGGFTSISVPASGSTHVSVTAGGGGILYTYTPADSAIAINQGEVFAVETDGGSTNTIGAAVTVIIE